MRRSLSITAGAISVTLLAALTARLYDVRQLGGIVEIMFYVFVAVTAIAAVFAVLAARKPFNKDGKRRKYLPFNAVSTVICTGMSVIMGGAALGLVSDDLLLALTDVTKEFGVALLTFYNVNWVFFVGFTLSALMYGLASFIKPRHN
jgi:uncharacterized membrane protein YidH (DUF202 family)